MPSFAQLRASAASTKADPLSTLCRRRHNVDYAEQRVVLTPAAEGLAAVVNAAKLSASSAAWPPGWFLRSSKEEPMARPVSKVTRAPVTGPLAAYAPALRAGLRASGYTPLSAVNMMRLVAHL